MLAGPTDVILGSIGEEEEVLRGTSNKLTMTSNWRVRNNEAMRAEQGRENLVQQE